MGMTPQDMEGPRDMNGPGPQDMVVPPPDLLAQGCPTSGLCLLAGALGGPGNVDGTGAAARFNHPNGVALDGAGNLYVADTNNSTIRKIQLANATVTTMAGVAGRTEVVLGPLPAELGLPQAVAPLPAGGLVILDENSVLVAR